MGADQDQLARRVGAITLGAIALVIAGFVFFGDQLALRSPTRIRVLFRHTGGLREHAALIVAGQPIGRIEAITPVAHGDATPLAGELGVAVTVAVDAASAWKVPARAELFIASRGPLAEKYLEVAPPAGDPGPAIHDGQALRGIDPPTLDNVLHHTWANMTTFKAFVAAVRPELTALRAQLATLRAQLAALSDDPRTAGGLRALLRETRELADAAGHTYASLGGEPGLERFAATLRDARDMVAQLRATLDLLGPRTAALRANLDRIQAHVAATAPLAHADRAIAALRAMLDKIDPLLASAGDLGERIANGEGSLLRLMRDPEFPEDAKDLGKIMKRQPWKIMERPHD